MTKVVSEGLLKKKIDEKAFSTTWETDVMIVQKKAILIDNLEEIIEEARKEIFPLPRCDLPINPKTEQRDIVVLDLEDWLLLINNLKKFFGEEANIDKTE